MEARSQTPAMFTTEARGGASDSLGRSERIIWRSFTLALLLVVAVCFVAVKQIGKGYSDAAPGILGIQTTSRISHIASEVRMVNTLLRQIALLYTSEGSKLDLKAQMRQGVIDPHLFATVHILDARGKLLLTSTEAPLGIDLSSTNAFRSHAATNDGSMLIEASAFGQEEQQDFAGFSQRLTGPNGSFAGVVLTRFKAEHFSQARSGTQNRFNATAHLVDRNGEILATLVGQNPGAIHDYKNHPLLKQISQGATRGVYESPLGDDGINRIFVYEKIPDLDLAVVSSVAARGWDTLAISDKWKIYASAGTLFLAIFALVIIFKNHVRLFNKALAETDLIVDQLKSSKESLSMAIVCGTVSAWDWSLLDKKFRVNEFFNSTFRSWPDEVNFLEDALLEQCHPEDGAECQSALRKHMRGESSHFDCESRLRDIAGNWRWGRMMGRVTERGPNHEPLRLSGTLMDITEKHLLEDKLKENRDQLSTIFALSQDAMVVFDQQLQVKYINPAFERLTHMQLTPLIGLDETQFTAQLNEICAQDAHFCGFPALREPSQTAGATAKKSIVLQAPMARVLMTTLTTSRSRTVSQILVLRDVSNENLIEKLKSEFLSTAAHEIRSPMTSILGFAELLSNSELNSDNQREFGNIILRQAHRIKGLLDELLDLARIDAGGGKHFFIESVNLRELVNTVVAEFIPPDGRPAPTINVPSRHCQIDFDKASQALLNVISNAYKYSSKTSAVHIAYVSPEASNHQDMAGITVQDSGIGMTLPEQQKIYERFYRVNQNTTVAGSGLGMAIVKEIMTQHSGEVVIKSAHGQGTCVTLLFPTTVPMQHALTPTLVAASKPSHL